MNLYRDCCRESCSLFRVLRHRTPSSPICPSEVICKPFALSRVFLLSSEGKSIVLVKKKAPSRSGFPLSMHVVLKTRHVNPNIHVRRYQSHVRSPNLSATRPQLLSLHGATNQYRSLHKAIQESVQSYIAFFAILYSSNHILIQVSPPTNIGSHHPPRRDRKPCIGEGRTPLHFPSHLSPIKEHILQTP